MADKYIIQIDPQINKSDANKMDKDLNRRFSRISKKFGKNLGNSMKKGIKVGAKALKGGLIGAAGAILAAIFTNPFQKISDDLNATLEKFDNTATRAAQFGVSSGKFFEAEQILASAGVKNFDAVMARFSTTLEKARPRDDGTTEDPYLREFLGGKDDLDAFYGFAKRLSQLNPIERNNAAETVFGEKIGLKIAEVFQTDLSKRRSEIFGNSNENDLTKTIDKLGAIEGELAITRAKLAATELQEKGKVISSESVKDLAVVEKVRLEKQVLQLSQFDVFAKLANSQENVGKSLEGLRSDITGIVAPAIEAGTFYGKKMFEWFSNNKTIKSATQKAGEIFR